MDISLTNQYWIVKEITLYTFQALVDSESDTYIYQEDFVCTKTCQVSFFANKGMQQKTINQNTLK